MTDIRPALAHGEPIIVVAPEGVDRAISQVMGRHRAELDEALQPFGVALDDLVQATWMRFVRFGDVVPLGTAEPSPDDSEACSASACDETCSMRRAAAAAASIADGGVEPVALPLADGVYLTDLPPDDGEGFGELLDEPVDAAGFELPLLGGADRAPMYGGRDEDGL